MKNELKLRVGSLNLTTRGIGKKFSSSWTPTWIISCDCGSMMEVTQREWQEEKYQQCFQCTYDEEIQIQGEINAKVDELRND